MSERVAITGATGQVGELLRERLVQSSLDAVPLGRDEDWAPALHAADVVVHLAGTLQPKGRDTYTSANVTTAETVAAAVRGSDVRRIVYLSYVGASADSPNAYLRAKADAEEALIGSGAPTTVFRCVHIFGPPDRPGPTAGAFLSKEGKSVTVPGDGRQKIAPLYVGDVVEAVLDAAGRADAPVGTFDIAGPEVMTMDEFVGGLNGTEVGIRHLPGPVARLAGRLSPSLSPALMDLLLCDNVPGGDAEQTAAGFGVSLHRLADVWDTRD